MPRSPSRDRVDRFTGNRGYFHESEAVRRWKNGMALVAIGLTLGWSVVEFAWPSRAVSAHSHGELAGPHAAFDAHCEACHKPRSSGSVLSTHERWHDLTCTKCHAGPAHHAGVADKAFHEDCSSCHHDHQGRNESLVRMSDSHCTKCHGNLPGSHVGGKSDIAEHVTGFARDHPEFRPLVLGKAEAERRLKFSHALHMTPGLVYDPNDQHKWTAAELAKQFVPNARERFSSQGSEPIQLQCSSCHQLDAGRVPAQDSERKSFDLIQRTVNGGAWRSLLPPRAEGAYYLPVNFDMHCKVCHPLRTPAAPSGGKVIPEFAVPHRRNPAALRTLLRGEFATRLVNQKHPSLLTPFGPGGRLDPPSSEAAATLGSEVDRLTDATLKTMLQNLGPIDEPGKKESWRAGGGFACGKCHYSTSPEPAKVEIAPLPLRSVWFEHAKFNHVSHRGLTCSSCHPGTEGSFAPGGNVNEREPALIAGIKTCQTCHAPAGQVVERPDGQTATAAGIRHSCVDCHRYHNGDRPLQGLGAAKRDPADPLTLSEWFRGMK